MFSSIGPSVKTMAIQSRVVVLVPSQPSSEHTIGATPKATAATVTSRAAANIQATNHP